MKDNNYPGEKKEKRVENCWIAEMAIVMNPINLAVRQQVRYKLYIQFYVSY